MIGNLLQDTCRIWRESNSHKAKLPIKVLMLTSGFSPCPQSSSQRFSSFADALLSRGARVVVVTSTRCLDKIKIPPQDKGFLVYNFDCPRFLLSFSNIVINPVILLQYFFLSLILSVQKKINVIFASVPTGETAIAGFFVAKLFRFPLIIDIRDIYPPPTAEFRYLPAHIPSIANELFVGFFRFLYRNSDKITCVYEPIKDILVNSKVLPEKVSLLPNGADASIYKPSSSRERKEIRSKYGLPLDKFIFVYAGSLSWQYPVHHALLGVKKLLRKGKDFQLLIVSFVNYLPYERMAKKLKVGNNVKFMGPLPIGDTAKIISACDVGLVALPGEEYFAASYGAKIFSYMSCGLPILASGTPGGFADNFIDRYRVGFFVGKPTKDSFEKGFLYFLENKHGIRNMGQNARKTVEELYDRKKIALKLASLIGAL